MTAELTADTITDDQILALRDAYLADRNLFGVDTCDVALGRHGARRNLRRVTRARARCAGILNRRADAARAAEKKSPKRVHPRISKEQTRHTSRTCEKANLPN